MFKTVQEIKAELHRALQNIPFFLTFIKRKTQQKVLNIRINLFKIRHFHKEIHLSGNPKISFCTTCMGRLYHLKETLVKNLEDNKDYPNLEFVILNYNSPDQMDEWAKKDLKDFIKNGKVQYYKTEDYKYYHSAHAKNIVHKLATGEIVCNVDADNFTGRGFASFLEETFSQNKMRVVHGHWSIQPGSTGRIAILKKYFMQIGGYNESIRGWGFDDIDLINRLLICGFEDFFIRDRNFLQLIENTATERIKAMAPEEQDESINTVRNRTIALSGLSQGKIRVNQGRRWGKTRVIKNFGEEIFEI